MNSRVEHKDIKILGRGRFLTTDQARRAAVLEGVLLWGWLKSAAEYGII